MNKIQKERMPAAPQEAIWVPDACEDMQEPMPRGHVQCMPRSHADEHDAEPREQGIVIHACQTGGRKPERQRGPGSGSRRNREGDDA
ncbi:MAG: hypothetical protein WC112_09795, partial [Proteiniphilum sp.]